ncbi:MAG: hypothetical protein L3K09_06745 [Thermoplasmata archaeon]|nr:hypothetical protein [Thermoplasmata archaeon]
MAIRRPPAIAERALFAEYPFLPGAESLVQELAPSLRELLDDPAFRRVRELGRSRVRAASDDPSGATGMAELSVAAPDERFLSFLYARLLLAAAPHRAPLRRWAVAEAKLAFARLRTSDLESLGDFAGRLGYELAVEGPEVSFPIEAYLKLAVPIREAEFRLASQRLSRGRVSVGRERAARLLQEGIRSLLSEPLEVTEEVVRALREGESEFLADLAERVPAPTGRGSAGFARLFPERFPPCIRKMRRMLNAGENLSHSGRFALAAFLHRAGADAETIVDSFRGAPDFDEGITRYQVEHITRRNEGQGYEPPECATLRTHGLCLRDGDPDAPLPADRLREPLCFEPTLRHPLQYYRSREPRGAPPPVPG